tara:strand:+ start:911 stop:1603 length:693 start_codon:yes stop_codon:yes gene_type:complete
MKVNVFQHHPSERLGTIKDWLTQQNATTSITHFYKNDYIKPNIDEIDALIILGGPMSVNDENILPWLIEEKSLIREAIRKNKKILGLCLGAQLIANALGGVVKNNRFREIGLFPINAVHSCNNFRFPDNLNVVHWHGQTFDLPYKSNLLATSVACKNQAFQINNNIIGLQFHLEFDADSIQRLIIELNDKLIASEYVQSKKQLRNINKDDYKKMQKILFKLLEYLFNKEF